MKRLIKRMQRKAMGGMVYARLYDDGSIRIRTDHPSNDPAVEIAMVAVVLGALRDNAPTMDYRPGPVTWRDDA